MAEDIAVTVSETGGLLAHRIDCAMVNYHRASNQPVLTMIGIQNEIPSRIKKHGCLEEDKQQAR